MGNCYLKNNLVFDTFDSGELRGIKTWDHLVEEENCLGQHGTWSRPANIRVLLPGIGTVHAKEASQKQTGAPDTLT